MGFAPYREAPIRERVDEPRDELSMLGSLRSTHLPLPLLRALAPAIAVAVVLALVFLSVARDLEILALPILLAFVLVIFSVVAHPPLRRRHVSVDLHTGGVVVRGAKRAEVVLFADVDEVWMEIQHGPPARTLAIRFVLLDGTKRTVPLTVREGHEIYRWALRQCTEPLHRLASEALRAGEQLHFGKLAIDRDGIRGPKWAAKWTEITLVRQAGARLALFRRQTIFPWRTIGLDDVPHPSLFQKLVLQRAPKSEIDELVSGPL